MQTENVKFSIEFNANPPVLHAVGEGFAYRIMIATGATFVNVADGVFALPGCPFPGQLLRARMHVYLQQHPRTCALTILFCVLAILCQILAMQLAPSEAVPLFISYVTFWTTLIFYVALIAVGGMTAIAAAVKVFATGSKLTVDFGGEAQKQKELAASTIDWGIDIGVIAMTANESWQSFQTRSLSAFASAQPGQWVCVIGFRTPIVAIVCTGFQKDNAGDFRTYEFLRTRPFETTPSNEGQINVAIKTFEKETYGQYLEYCRQFAADFIPWSETEKQGQVSPIDKVFHFTKIATHE